MGGHQSKDTKVVKAENFHQLSLDAKSFSALNASGMEGALLFFVIMLLATLGYSLARYKDYAKKCRVRAQAKLPLTPGGWAWH